MPPSKKVPDVIGIILQCLEDGMPVKRACQYAQIHPDTFYGWCEKDSSFRLKADFAKSAAIRRLIKKQEDKDPWKILKNIDSEHFKDEQEQKVTVVSYAEEVRDDSGDKTPI